MIPVAVNENVAQDPFVYVRDPIGDSQYAYIICREPQEAQVEHGGYLASAGYSLIPDADAESGEAAGKSNNNVY